MKPDKRDLLDRAERFLNEHPDSSAATIAAALASSTKIISQSLVRDPRFIAVRSGTSPNLCYRLVSNNEPVPVPVTSIPTLQAAIESLHAPMVDQFRREIDSYLSEIVRNELATIADAINGRVRARLAVVLTAPTPVEPHETAQPSHAKALAREPSPKWPTSPPVFTNPPGDPVAPHDILSRRTSHKAHGLTIHKSTAVGMSTVERLKPLKIIVVGLHSNKQELIKKEFRDKFDLRLFNPDQLVFIKKAINAGDVVICMADYISHKHTEVAEAEGGQVVIVHGGIPSLRDELAERYEIFRLGSKAA